MWFILGRLIGWVVTLATFPGVIVHEVAHQLFCRFFRVAVFEVCYFRPGNPAGYVVHESPRMAVHHLLIGFGPFLLNSLLGALIVFPAAIPALQFEAGSGVDYFLIWLGVSIAMHAFPSTGDAKSIWQTVRSERASWGVRLIGIPLVGVIYLGAVGSAFWLDLAYAVALAMFFPGLLVSLLV